MVLVGGKYLPGGFFRAEFLNVCRAHIAILDTHATMCQPQPNVNPAPLMKLTIPMYTRQMLTNANRQIAAPVRRVSPAP